MIVYIRDVTNYTNINESIRLGNFTEILNILYKKCLPKVRSYVLKNRGNQEDVKDVFQDAVTTLLYKMKAEGFVPKGDINKYVFVSCRNIWINKAKRNGTVIYVEQEIEQEDDSTSQVDSIIQDERVSLVRSLMEKLGEPCKTLLKHLYFDELSLKEIVVKMGISSVGVAKTNSFRCKQKLTKLVATDKKLQVLMKEIIE